MNVNKKIILGLDPGFADTGFGLLQKDKNGLQFIAAGSIQTSRDKKFSERLVIIYQEITNIFVIITYLFKVPSNNIHKTSFSIIIKSTFI